MNDKDQRLYKLLEVGIHGRLFEGDRCVNATVDTLGELTESILRDYINVSKDELSQQLVSRVTDMLYDVWVERGHLVEYGVCGLSIRECIDERERPEDI